MAKATGKKSDSTKLRNLKREIHKLIAWPDENYPRRTEEGFPSEFVYDQFAYERIVRGYRDALTRILKDHG